MMGEHRVHAGAGQLRRGAAHARPPIISLNFDNSLSSARREHGSCLVVATLAAHGRCARTRWPRWAAPALLRWSAAVPHGPADGPRRRLVRHVPRGRARTTRSRPGPGPRHAQPADGAVADGRVRARGAATSSRRPRASTAPRRRSCCSASCCRSCAPGLAAAGILAFVFSWNEFAVALNLTQKATATVPVAIAKYAQEYEIRYTQMAAARGALHPARPRPAPDRAALHRPGPHRGSGEVGGVPRGGTMKAVFVLFNSLNRHMLGALWRHPHPDAQLRPARAQTTVTFDKHYVGSLPCMPARRDMQTGRLNFLHRSWGPLEPFDNSFPELLRRRRLQPPRSPTTSTISRTAARPTTTATTRSSSSAARRATPGRRWSQPHWERLRRDVPRAAVQQRPARATPRSNMINREFIREETDFPLGPVLRAGARVPRHATATPTAGCCRSRPSTRTSRSTRRRASGRRSDRLERADPRLAALWPGRRAARRMRGAARQLLRARRACATTCSASCSTISTRTTCGRTPRSIVTTDHGFLLGEHDFWAKNRMNLYEEIVAHPALRAPPRPRARQAGARRGADADDRPGADLARALRRRRARRDAGAVAAAAARRRRPARATARSSAISAAPSTSPTAATPIIATRATCGRRRSTSTR